MKSTTWIALALALLSPYALAGNEGPSARPAVMRPGRPGNSAAMAISGVSPGTRVEIQFNGDVVRTGAQPVLLGTLSPEGMKRLNQDIEKVALNQDPLIDRDPHGVFCHNSMVITYTITLGDAEKLFRREAGCHIEETTDGSGYAVIAMLKAFASLPE